MAFDVSYIFEAVNKFSPVANQVGKSLDEVQKKVTSLNSRMSGLSSRMSSIGGSLRSVGKSLALSVTAPLVGIATYAIKSADNFAELNKMLIVTTGSAQLAGQAMDKIKSMSMATEFAPEELEGSIQRMMALGSTLDEAIKKTETLSKVAEGTGGGLDQIVMAYTRMSVMAKKSGGAIDTRSLVMLAKQGIPIMAELQKMATERGQNLDNILSKGKIGFASIDEAFSRIARNKAADTLGESLKRLHNIGRSFAADLGNAVMSAFGIKEGLSGLDDILARNEEKFRIFLETHKALVKWATIIAGIAAALAPVAIILSVIATLVGLIMSPFFLIAATITAIAVGLYLLYKRSAVFRFMVDGIYKIFKGVYDIVMKIINGIKYLIGLKPHINIGGAEPGIGANNLLQQIKSPMGTASTMQHKVNSEMTINIHDPNKYVQSVKSTGTTKFNLGHSMAY